MQNEQLNYSRELERPTALSKPKHALISPKEAAEADAKLALAYGGPVCGVDEAGRGCEVSDAEVLTKRGWMIPSALSEDDLILSHTGAGDLVWQPINGIIRKHHEGNIIEYSNGDGLLLRVTPDHCFDVLKRISKNRRQIGWRQSYSKLSEIVANDALPRTGLWRGAHREEFILTGEIRSKMDTQSCSQDRHIPMPQWLSFIGIYLAEGCCVRPQDGNYRVRIAQFKAENTERIENLLKSLPFNFRRTAQGFECHDKNLWTYLSPLGDCYTKRIPCEIKDLEPDLLGILLEWFTLGDGNVYQCKGNRKPFTTLYTSSPKLRDDLEELLLKSGRSYTTTPVKDKVGFIRGCSIQQTCPNYRIVIKTERTTSFKHLKKREASYSGEVFCLNLNTHHNFCVRRNGRSYFTGNSWAGPIVAAAVILPVGLHIPKLTDSKALSRETRDELCKAIHEVALGIGVAQVSAEDIDRRGLTWANTYIFEQAAIECVEDMRRRSPGALPGVYYLDQIQGPTPDLQPHVMTPKADSRSHAVAAASVIAKTFRDDIMRRLGLQHPEYSFEAHKGYINATHTDAVQKHGRLQGIHRFSYNVQIGDAPADPFARWRPK